MCVSVSSFSKRPKYTSTRSHHLWLQGITYPLFHHPFHLFIAVSCSPFPAECRFNCASLERSGVIVSIWESGHTKVPGVYHCFLGHHVFYPHLPFNSTSLYYRFENKIVKTNGIIFSQFCFLSLPNFIPFPPNHLLSLPSSKSLLFHLFPRLFHFFIPSIICVCGWHMLCFLIVSPLTAQTFKPSIWHLSLVSIPYAVLSPSLNCILSFWKTICLFSCLARALLGISPFWDSLPIFNFHIIRLLKRWQVP